MRPKRLSLLQNHRPLGTISIPVDLAVLQIMERDPADQRLLIDQCFLGERRPMVSRRHDQALGKGFAARGSEKAVDILLLQLVIRRVELALDGMEITRTGLLSNQIDTIIPCRSKAVFRRPFRPCPYPRIQVLVSRLVAQVSKH